MSLSPKENLELPTATHVLGGAGVGAGEGVVRDESSAQLWRARAAVDRAATCAIRVDDCNRAQLAAAQSWRPVAPDAVRSLEVRGVWGGVTFCGVAVACP